MEKSKYDAMKIDFFVNSVFNSITWILPITNKDCWLVDCGDIDRVINEGWNVKGVLLTHVHYDHIYGLNLLLEHFPNVCVITNEEGYQALTNPRWNFSRYHIDVEDFVFKYMANVNVVDSEGVFLLNDTFVRISNTTSDNELENTNSVNLNGMRVSVYFTPGHEPSCLCYRIKDMVFTGDSYIPGVKVVTTFPRSNKSKAAESLLRIKSWENEGVKIMPGHKV